jgi:hypothetical protein
MGNANVQLPPKIKNRLEREAGKTTDDVEKKFPNESEAIRYYLALGMGYEDELRSRVDDLELERNEWREQARYLRERLNNLEDDSSE